MKYFFTEPNAVTLLEFTVIQETEKAYKCEVVSIACMPGTNDKGDFAGFAWVPKKAIQDTKKDDTKKLAKWYKMELFGRNQKNREAYAR